MANKYSKRMKVSHMFGEETVFSRFLGVLGVLYLRSQCGSLHVCLPKGAEFLVISMTTLSMAVTSFLKRAEKSE